MSVFLWKRDGCMYRLHRSIAVMLNMFLIEQRPAPPLWSGSTSERACAYCKLGYSRFPGVIVFCFVAGDGACNASVLPTDRLSVCQSAIDASRSLTSLYLCALIMEHWAKFVANAVTLESSLVRTEVCVLHVLSQKLHAKAGQRLNPMKCDIFSLNEIRVIVTETYWACDWNPVLLLPEWNTAKLCLNSYSSPF